MARREGKATLRVTKGTKDAHGGIPLRERQEDVPPVVEGARPSNVGFGVTYTKNIGNYESIRVNVDCHLPCEEGDEDDTYKRARTFVMNKMRKELARIEADLER
jgi:hypothetical protein